MGLKTAPQGPAAGYRTAVDMRYVVRWRARRLQVGAHRRRNRPLRRRGTHQGHLWRTDKIYSCGKHPSLTCIKLSWANCGDPALPCTTDKSDAAARAIDVSRQNDVNTLPWLDHPSLQEITACAHGERRDDSDCALAM